MKKWGTKIAVNFLVRGIVSFAIIFFVNGFLDGQGISACVGEIAVRAAAALPASGQCRP